MSRVASPKMADSREPSPEPHRTPLEALLQRLPLSGSWRAKAAHLAILFAVSVLAALTLSPGLYGPSIPHLTRADLGKPFRAASPAGFKASRDYEIVDQAATEKLRVQAKAKVLPVYDFNPSVLPDIEDNVHQAFVGMRGAIAKAQTQASAAPTEVTPKGAHSKASKSPRAKHEKAHGHVRTASAAEKAAIPADSLPVLQGRSDFEKALLPGEKLHDEDFQALLASGFSPRVEKATLELLKHAYPVPVAQGRDELSRVGGDGITVRDLARGTERTSKVGLPVISDVREAKAAIDRFASLPGAFLPDSPAMLRRAVLRLARSQVHPNLTINANETAERRKAAAAAVKQSVIEIKKGQKVIGDGELITPTDLLILDGMRAQTNQLDVFWLKLGRMGLVLLLIAGTFAFFRVAFHRFRPTRKDAVLLGGLLIGILCAMHLFVAVADAVHERYVDIPPEALYYCIPIAAGAMLVRFVLSDELALFFSVVVACLAGLLLNGSLSFAIFALVGSLVAADRIRRAKDRVGIFRAGLVTAAVNLALVIFLSLGEGKGLSADTFWTAGFAFLGTALAVPIVVMGLTPLIEAIFGYASDLKLLELANLNHPALKELIVQAPGTYHHSIIIGSLVEGAAEAIGANPLLARSCAYYHDIGKGRNPLYFGENQKGENRHDALAPAMSAVIIKRHVTEGMEMARHYKLPKPVADAIPQHHGTRVVGYFYHKALKEQEGKDGAPPVDDAIYRYPGPKPQFREAALVMIADAVEASSRALAEPTTERLQALVQKMINIIFSEGQLDECEITLRDLNLIAQSFLRTLEGIYHTRPTYPPGAVGGDRPAHETKAAGLALAAPKPSEPAAAASEAKTASSHP